MAWTQENYITKASYYWNNGTSKERGSNDYIFGVAMCLEFTIRGALCYFNPSLNAAADEESLLFSVGVTPNRPPKSVELSVAFNRLLRLMPEITEKEQTAIKALIDIRNIELHSDEAAFDGMETNVVLPSILSVFVRVTGKMGGDLEQLLGAEDAKQARATFDALSKDRTVRIGDLIKIQKDRFFGQTADVQKICRDEHTPKFRSAVVSGGHHVKAHKCPACSGLGILGGNPTGRSSPLLNGDGIFYEIRIVPSLFSCKICELNIKGLDELMAAKMPHEFTTHDYVDAVEHLGIDVMDYVDVDEIVREHSYEAEYMDE